MTQTCCQRSKVQRTLSLCHEDNSFYTHTCARTHAHHTLDKPSVEALAGKVEEASKVLSEYNSRLEAELKERREIQELLDAFTWQQKELLRGAKKRLKVSSLLA